MKNNKVKKLTFVFEGTGVTVINNHMFLGLQFTLIRN